MAASSSTEDIPQSSDLVSSLTTKKRPRKATTRKQSVAAKSNTKKSTTKKPATPKSKARKSTPKKATTAPKRRTTVASTTKRTTASLKSDLKKLVNERYATSDFTRGAIVLIEQEGVEILRDALFVLLSSKTPLVGGMVSNIALDTLLDKVTDTYKKLTVADRKALRAVINWLRGDANTDAETQQNLVTLLNGQPSANPSIPVGATTTPLGPNDLQLKPLR